MNLIGESMVTNSHAEIEVDARDLRVRFSPAVQDALRTIAVCARDSEHFDSGIYEIIKDWSSGKATTVHDVMIALPAISREVAAHLATKKDGPMGDAWDELCAHLPEKGFTVSQSRQRRR